jgi:outer membrane protein assembly factor BamB
MEQPVSSTPPKVGFFRPRRYPGPIASTVITLAALTVVTVRVIGRLEHQPRFLDDPAIRNLVAIACWFFALMSLWAWFSFFSVYSRRARYAVAALPLLGVPAGLATIWGVGPTQVIQFSGSMMPQFAGGERPLSAVEASGGPVDLRTTTQDDFPQFLGPDRNDWVRDPGLTPDWSAKEPRQLWKRPIGAGWSSFAAVNGFAVTMEQRGSDEVVVCYAIETGEPLWSHSIPARHEQAMGGIGPRSTPTIHIGRVYTLGATGVLQCFDGSSGKVLWSQDLRNKYGVTAQEDEKAVMWGRAASPLIVDAMVVVPGGGKKPKNLVAFEAETGSVVWESECIKEDGTADQIGYASPSLVTVAGRRQIVIVNESTASGHDPETGKQLWSFPWPGHSNGDAGNSQAAVVDDRHLLLSKGYSVGAELIEVTAGSESHVFATKSVWKIARVLQTKFTNVVIHDGYAYGLSEEILECVELATGKRKWKSGRFGHGQVLGVGNFLIVLSEDGELNLVELNPSKFVSHGSVPALEGKTWNNLCLYGKRLLVRNAQEAACFELP